jgi:two-component system, NarL family, nitrate/nitrite response regulator NarL
MAIRVATIIIEPHLLVREALDSLMEGHSYRVVCGVGSLADIPSPSIAGNGPKLVILGEQSVDDAVRQSADIRRLWPDSKIVLLFEYASPDDFHRLLVSEIDGCVPLFVSPDTLISTLDVVMSGDGRVLILSASQRASIQPAMPGEKHQTEAKDSGSQAISVEVVSAPLATIDVSNVSNISSVPGVPSVLCASNVPITVNGNGAIRLHEQKPDTLNATSSRRLPRLSERETQILDGLVKGHANKVIARTYDITEATVKVHMKSILRKIQVANRTQAAIWALEHGYSTDEIKDRLLEAADGC